MLEYMIEVSATMTLDQIINGIKECIINYEEDEQDEENLSEMLIRCHFFILKLSSESVEGGAPQLIKKMREIKKD